jgi:hypothetical protein
MTPKTEELLAKDVNGLIKLILTEMESLAAAAPSEACEPYTFEERRQRVFKKVWRTIREAVRYGQSHPA